MKTVIATALTVALAAGCSSSDDDSSTAPLNDAADTPTGELNPDNDVSPAVDTPVDAPIDTDTAGEVVDVGDVPTDEDADEGVDAPIENPAGDATDGTETDVPVDPDAESEADPDAGDADGAGEDAVNGMDGSDDPGAQAGEAPALDDSFNDLILALAIYEADALAVRVLELSNTAADTALASRDVAGSTVALSTAEDSRVLTTDALQVDCALGGNLVSELGTGGEASGGSGEELSAAVVRFDECRLSADSGEVVVDGSLTVTRDFQFGSRAQHTRSLQAWGNLSVTEADGRSVEIDGTISYSRDNDTVFQNQSRIVDVSRYVEGNNGVPTDQRTDVAFVFNDNASATDLFFTPSGQASGTVMNELTGSASVTLETITPLRREIRDESQIPDGEDPRHFFDGELLFSSDNGDTLTVTGRMTATFDSFVDTRFTGSDGTVRERENVPFADVQTPAPPTVD